MFITVSVSVIVIIIITIYYAKDVHGESVFAHDSGWSVGGLTTLISENGSSGR